MTKNSNKDFKLRKFSLEFERGYSWEKESEKQKAGKSILEILEESRGFTITNTYYNNFVNLNKNNENNPRTRAPYSSVGKRKRHL